MKSRCQALLGLGPTVIVWNRDLKRWRRDIGGRPDGFVASQMLFHFANEAIGPDWDLADPVARSGVLEQVASLLTERAMAWFDLFDERLEVLATWDFNIKLLSLDRVVELLLFLGRQDDALALVGEAMKRDPWSGFDDGSPVFADVRKLGAAFSIDFPVPAGRDPAAEAAEAAAVARLHAALDAYTRR